MRSGNLSSLSTPYNRAHHWFAVLTAFCTFLLIVLGALVTSNEAGLSVPDWPTSFHHWPITFGYFTVPLVGGIKWEHGHRMLAQLIGILTIALAVWTQRADRRSWMRKLGWAALALVIAQGILGGITVLHLLPPSVSSAHAALAQGFFCLVVAMALFTGRAWVEAPRLRPPARRPALPALSSVAVAAVYVQLILGAAFRHNGMRLLPHLIGAALVTVILLWTIVRVLSDYSRLEQLCRPALMLLALLMVQLALGFGAWMTRLGWGSDAVQPLLPMVVTTVAHVSVGALLLATTVVLAIQARRHITVAAGEERVAAEAPKAIAV
jgi:cytochrome c oxidase assembly protein subunit 15